MSPSIKATKAAAVSSAISALLCMAHAQAPPVKNQQPDLKSAFSTADFSALPALPHGKSTVLGGQITNLDPVLDQFTLRIFGERPMKILFDERTQVYRNGARVPLRDLRDEQHASVQTALEGPNVFALTIHMLSDIPHGETEGRVLDYNPETRELTLGSSLSREPIRLFLRQNTPVVRTGQSAFAAAAAGQADLVNGALVDVNFDPSDKGRAVANRVTVLAKPGSDFVFSGKVASLDMHSGVMVLLDPRDQKSYEISFNPAAQPVSNTLHVGDQVRVSAAFDGTRYTAAEITRTAIAQP
jgi:hypothetical protein